MYPSQCMGLFGLRVYNKRKAEITEPGSQVEFRRRLPQSENFQIMSPKSVLMQGTYFESTWQVLSGSSSLEFGGRRLCVSMMAALRSAAHRTCTSLWLFFSSRIVLCCSWSFFFCFSISCCWKTWRLWKWPMQMGFAFWMVVLSFSLLSGCWEVSTSKVLCGLLSEVFRGTFWSGTCKVLFVGLLRWGLGMQSLLSEGGFSHKRGPAVTWERRKRLQSAAVWRTVLPRSNFSQSALFCSMAQLPGTPVRGACAPGLAISQAVFTLGAILRMCNAAGQENCVCVWRGGWGGVGSGGGEGAGRKGENSYSCTNHWHGPEHL